jgi:hypothetical protein
MSDYRPTNKKLLVTAALMLREGVELYTTTAGQADVYYTFGALPNEVADKLMELAYSESPENQLNRNAEPSD